GFLRVLLSLGLLTVFTGLIAYMMMALAGKFEPKVSLEVAASAAKPVPGQTPTTVKLIKRPRFETAVGTVRPVHEVAVGSKILARVKEVRVRAGQVVSRDEVMVLLDDADLKSRREQANSMEAAAKAKLEGAKVDLERAQRLRAHQATSQENVDKLTTAFRTATAELERARESIRETEIIEGYATIRAPMAGIVIDKRVNAGDTVTPGQVLFTMYDPSRMQMVATVRESLASRLKVDQMLPAHLDTIDLTCQARVSEIVPESQAESRSFLVKVTGPCPPNVYSGMFGRIFIPVDEEEVLVVPPEAVERVGQLDEVIVMEKGVPHRRIVRLGRALEEGREVLSGLRAGERVVPARPGKETSEAHS
ncbi:MAG: efflux RND transporter periplasmic adaptor subunit, partial [Planctomycetota bacterium]|nr:efflux RND transporter periplasmic adaptor subunit [Planctomycetota bacterium]